MAVVLDAWALLAVVNAEPAAGRVLRVVAAEGARMSWINLGEVYYRALRDRGREATDRRFPQIRELVWAEAPDPDLVLHAARLKARGGISYAHCFAVATAQRHREAVVTADPEILALGAEVDVIDPRA